MGQEEFIAASCQKALLSSNPANKISLTILPTLFEQPRRGGGSSFEWETHSLLCYAQRFHRDLHPVIGVFCGATHSSHSHLEEGGCYQIIMAHFQDEETN